MLVTRLVRGMVVMFGFSLLVGGAYLAWGKRAELAKVVPGQKAGAEVFYERLEASRMVSEYNTLDRSAVQVVKKAASERGRTAREHSRQSRRQGVGRS